MKITVYTFTIDDEHGMRTLVFPTAAARNAAIAERGNIPGDPASPDWLDEQADEIEEWKDRAMSVPFNGAGWESYFTWDEHEIELPKHPGFACMDPVHPLQACKPTCPP